MTGSVLRAAEFAAEKHGGQVRKGTSVPYVTHPLMVAQLVLGMGGSESEVVAAILHDVVEDCGVTRDELVYWFGEEVAEIVIGCSTEPGTKATWRARKQRYLEHLRHASPSVRMVAGADKFHNAQAIALDLASQGAKVWERFTGGKDGVLWYYGALVEVLAGSEFGDHLAIAVARMKEEA